MVEEEIEPGGMMAKTVSKFTVATEMPSGARSRGYSLDDDKALKWFELVLKQMKEFNILGTSVLLLESETEVSRESI